ncbi:SOS response-associated peptidase family protein [Duganella sp. BuS-21]|uniref:SOS response-associated peptidase family protein n=1 Tax=Duganella sp. BuS-21 TaxID=2943848 RepID=UPI0035A6AE22
MCVNYITVGRQICFDWFKTPMEVDEAWRDDINQDYRAPFIIHDERGQRRGQVGTYGFVPQRHRPYKKLTPAEEQAVEEGREVKRKRIPMHTMNARAEEVGSKVTYKRFWLQQQLCIVPALGVFEPNWETGQHERWLIKLASGEPFGLPGMWRTWEEEDGTVVHTFNHFTLNANEHPLLKRFHSDEEKRGVAILRPEHYDDWLGSNNPEFARALIGLYPAQELSAAPAPRPPRQKEVSEAVDSAPPVQADLF